MKTRFTRACQQVFAQPFQPRFKAFYILVLSGGYLVGCSSSPTPKYYSLAMPVTPAVSNVKAIEVMPVSLPDRLNRVYIMIQEKNGRAKILENQRWTSMFGMELRDSLSAGLQQKLGAVDRYNNGMTGQPVYYRIATDFSRFDITETAQNMGQGVDVSVAWIVKKIQTQPVSSQTTNPVIPQLTCKMNFVQPLQSNTDVEQMVQASRQALRHVVETIADSVVAMNVNQQNQTIRKYCS